MPNPIFGESEGEQWTKRMKDEYSQYVWNGLREEDQKHKSRSRSWKWRGEESLYNDT